MYLIYILLGYAAVLGLERELPIGLITSHMTDTSFLKSLNDNIDGVGLKVQNLLDLNFKIRIYWERLSLESEYNSREWIMPDIFVIKDVRVILDASNYPMFSQYLAYIAMKSDLLVLVLGRPIDEMSGETPSSNILYLETSFISQASAFVDIISKFQWTNLGLVYNQDLNNLKLADQFKEIYDTQNTNIWDELVVDIQDKTDSERLQHRLESTTRESGARVILVFTDPVLAAQLLHAGDESVMGGSGYAWLLNSDAMNNIGEIAKHSHADLPSESFGVLKTGAIGFVEEDGEYLRSEPLGTYKSALTLISMGYKYLGFPYITSKSISGSALRSYFLSNPSTPTLPYRLHFDSNGIKKTYYDLYNIVDFVAHKVGYWDSDSRQIELTVDLEELYWPGMDHNVPDDKVPIIKIGLLYPNTTLSGDIDPEGESIYNAFELALKEINEDNSILKDYNLQFQGINTAGSGELAVVMIKSMANLNILGYVGPLETNIAEAYLNALASYQDPKPLVSYGVSAANFTSPENYPKFLRTIQPDGLQAVVIAMYIQQQIWKRIGVIYTTDILGTGIYESFISNVLTLEITIVNEDTKRAIGAESDGSPNSDTESDIDRALSEIVRKQIKVIVYLGSDIVSLEVAKAASKKELKGADYMWLGGMWITQRTMNLLETEYEDDKEDILEVFNGALGLDFRPPNGAIGEKFKNSYKEAYGSDPSDYAMLAYDSAYLYARTIDTMISRGNDFNSGKELTDSLRAADFTAASGKLKFTESTNDRSAYGYKLVNVQYGEIVTVGEYNPEEAGLYIFDPNTPIIYGSGSSTKPTDEWSSTFDCPFAEHMVSISFSGLGIVIGIGAFLFILTLGLSFFSYKKWRQVPIQEITQPVVRSWKDTLVQVTIIIEFFQFVAIAPSFESLKIVIQAASNIFMLDIIKVAQEDKSSYWMLLAVVSTMCYIWFVLVMCIVCNAEKWLSRTPFLQRSLAMMNALYLPLIGNTMFLPFTALLLDVFVCDHQAQGSTFVWRDCYFQCWDDQHYSYIAMSTVAIACFEPIAVFSRPLWQVAKTGLNLMAKPYFLLFKTCVQILLIAVGKSLQGTSPVAHGVVFSVLILAFTIITFKIKPFNYHRCNLWEVSSLIAVFYMSFLATLSHAANPEHLAWFIVLMIGWGLIAIGTFLVQKFKCPNLLINPSEANNKKKIFDNILKKSKDITANDMDKTQLKGNDEQNEDVDITPIVPSGTMIQNSNANSPGRTLQHTISYADSVIFSSYGVNNQEADNGESLESEESEKSQGNQGSEESEEFDGGDSHIGYLEP